MILGKITGNVVSTIKAKGYESKKILIVQPIDPKGNPKGKSFLAIDSVQAGVGDVVISLSKNSTANKIRKGLKDKILKYYQNGNPLYIVAHSLGTVYAFDVVNELIADNNYFDRNDPLNWPVQGMITLGSPLGLRMFKSTGRNNARNLGDGQFNFKWMNYFDVNDPVVSGDIFGKRLNNYKIAENYRKGTASQGWFIRDYPTDTGKTWLLAHTAYWNVAAVGEGLVNMLV